VIETRLVTNALKALLAEGSGKPVGEGVKPEGDPSAYYILHFIDRQTHGAPYADLNEDCTLIYQVDAVSGRDVTDPDSYGTQEQMEWLADKARTVFLGRDPVTRRWLHDLVVPGVRVMGRAPEVEAGGTPGAADGIMSSASRFRFDLTSV
jgi:hypothetical protein